MGIPLAQHSALGIFLSIPGFGIMLAYGTGAPTASISGYGKGCLYIRMDGTAGNEFLYVNSGTAASATWIVYTAA